MFLLNDYTQNFIGRSTNKNHVGRRLPNNPKQEPYQNWRQDWSCPTKLKWLTNQTNDRQEWNQCHVSSSLQRLRKAVHRTKWEELATWIHMGQPTKECYDPFSPFSFPGYKLLWYIPCPFGPLQFGTVFGPAGLSFLGSFRIIRLVSNRSLLGFDPNSGTLVLGVACQPRELAMNKESAHFENNWYFDREFSYFVWENFKTVIHLVVDSAFYRDHKNSTNDAP